MDADGKTQVLQELSRMIRNVQEHDCPPARAVPTGLGAVDADLAGGPDEAGGLPLGGIHEFFADGPQGDSAIIKPLLSANNNAPGILNGASGRCAAPINNPPGAAFKIPGRVSGRAQSGVGQNAPSQTGEIGLPEQTGGDGQKRQLGGNQPRCGPEGGELSRRRVPAPVVDREFRISDFGAGQGRREDRAQSGDMRRFQTATAETEPVHSPAPLSSVPWPVPVSACILTYLARRAAMALDGRVIFVGRRCWPNPQFLARMGMLDGCLFVDAVTVADRLWAIELAMRCPAAAAVVGDAGQFRMPATRRLELAARDAGSLVLLARPGAERAMPSAATTRWSLRPRVSQGLNPAWTLELLRCKGRQAKAGPYGLEWDYAQGSIAISPAVVDRLPEAQTSQELDLPGKTGRIRRSG